MGKKCCDSVSTSSSSSACVNTEKDCCKCVEVVNCCTPQYQRLDKLRNQWSLINAADSSDDIYDEYIYDRAGNQIDYSGWSGKIYSDETFDSSDLSGNLMVAFAFVVSHRYINIERCKSDQVWGWYVNVKNGDLVFMQETERVSNDTSRHEIYNKPCNQLTVDEKRAKSVMDRFFNLSTNVINECRYPRTEGDMVETTDSCGQKWLVAVNFVDTLGGLEDNNNSNNGITTLAQSGKYVIVACKL